MLIIVTFMTLFGVDCADDSDDDDNNNDATDDDDSDSGSCSQTINPGGGETTSISMNDSSTAIADCLPELPDPIHEELLTALLEAYLGQYYSEVGTIRTISCRPEGEWIVPVREITETWCDSYYLIPVLIELEEEAGIFRGNIEQLVTFKCTIDDLFTLESYLKIEKNDQTVTAYGSIDVSVIWEFGSAYEEPGFITWTKDEPFEK